MDRVTIYLRTTLFALPGEGHVPLGASIVEGTIVERAGGALTLAATRFLDDRGRELGEVSVTLLVPWSKIDHVHVHGT